MLKRLLVAAMATTSAAGIGYADRSKPTLTIRIDKTAPTDGKQMYTNYCAPCHGANGTGHGTYAPALKTSPTDLTALSRNNRGKFPDTHLMNVLQLGPELPHGTAEMPVWGPILGKMNRTNGQETLIRMSILTSYLQTLQAK